MVATITGLVVLGNQRHFGAKVAARILSFYCRSFPTVESEEALQTCCVRICVVFLARLQSNVGLWIDDVRLSVVHRVCFAIWPYRLQRFLAINKFNYCSNRQEHILSVSSVSDALVLCFF